MEIKAKHILLLGAFIVLTLLGYKFLPRDEIMIQTNQNQKINLTSSGNLENLEMIFVHIEGAVHFPGIKEVLKGTRLFELIEIAGGTTLDADTSKVNLASILKDEQKIYIPFIVNEDSLENMTNSEYLNTENNKLNQNSNQLIENDMQQDFLINLNDATEEDLQKLEGIGPAMAKKIIAYREENGYFGAIEEIRNVSGIGEAKYNKIKDFITI